MRKAVKIIRKINKLETELKSNYTDVEIVNAIIEEEVKQDRDFSKDDGYLIHILYRQSVNNMAKETLDELDL